MPQNELGLLDLLLTLKISVGFFGLGIILTLTTAIFNIHTLGQIIFAPTDEKRRWEPKPFWLNFWIWQMLVIFCVTFAVGVRLTEFNLYEIFDEDGFAGAVRIFSALVQPSWPVLSFGLVAIIETIYIAFMATALALPIAFFLAFFAAKNITSGNRILSVIYISLRTFMNITRSIEPLIWAIIFSVWVGIGPFAGMLGLLLHSISSLTKQYSEIIECVEEGPIEGVKATGANPIQVIWYAIVPQILLPYISFTIYRWDINVRMATVIGLVGGGGIGTLLIQYQGQALWHEVGTLALLIVVTVWIMDIASAYLRAALK